MLYWPVFGTIMLIVLTYQDFKTKGWIDDRKNFFMMGVTISLITHTDVSIWYLFFLMAYTIVFNIAFSKTFGRGDISALAWGMYGFGIIGLKYLVSYLVVVGVAYFIYYMVKVYIMKIDASVKTPFTVVVLLCFLFNSILAFWQYF